MEVKPAAAAAFSPCRNAAFIPAIQGHDELDTLTTLVDKEVLVVNGEGDLLTPPAHSEKIVERLPGSEHVVVQDAGHLIMLEHPEVITGQVLALLHRAEVDAAEALSVVDKPRVRRTIIDIAKGRRVKKIRAGGMGQRTRSRASS